MTTGSDGTAVDRRRRPNVVSATAADPPVLDAVRGRDRDRWHAGRRRRARTARSPTRTRSTRRRTSACLGAGGTPQKIELENTDPFGVTFGQDGAYWISRFQGNDLLRLTTDGQITMLGGFSAAAGPRKIATGPGNTLWTTLDLAEKIGA